MLDGIGPWLGRLRRAPSAGGSDSGPLPIPAFQLLTAATILLLFFASPFRFELLHLFLVLAILVAAWGRWW